MTRASYIFLTTALFVGITTKAHAWNCITDHAYAGLSAGVDLLEDNDLESGDDVDYGLGYAIGGQFGCRMDRLRIETELGLEQADIDSISGADFESVTFGIGAYADLTKYATYKQFVPYVGFGIALASTEFDDDDDTSFTAHAEVGAAFPLSDHVDIGPAYRFRWLDTDAGDLSDDQLIHQIKIAIRFYFDEQ